MFERRIFVSMLPRSFFTSIGLTLLIKEIAHPFQEEHAEDVFLVLGRIHVSAQVVAGAEEQAGQLAEGEFGHIAGEV
jgi:hypothetical protein